MVINFCINGFHGEGVDDYLEHFSDFYLQKTVLADYVQSLNAEEMEGFLQYKIEKDGQNFSVEDLYKQELEQFKTKIEKNPNMLMPKIHHRSIFDLL